MIPNIPSYNRRQAGHETHGAIAGENRRDMSERLDSSSAEIIDGYELLGDGRMKLMKGLETLEAVGSSSSTSLIERLSDDILVYGYVSGTDTKIATYTLSTDASATIKTVSSSTEDLEGVQYGDYFFVASGTGSNAEQISMFHKDYLFLKFDALTASFKSDIGGTVTGGASSDTGTLVQVYENDDTGVGIMLISGATAGDFQNNETITTTSGSATADGVATQYVAIADAPKAKHLSLYNARTGSHLVAANTDDNKSQVVWAKSDIDPTEVPFQDWSPLSTPDPNDAGVVLYRGGGNANSIVTTEDKVIAFWDDATAIYHLEIKDDSDVGLTQETITDFQEKDFGGYRGAIGTPYGIFYANEQGIKVMTFSQGSKSDVDISDILGEDQMEDIDLSDAEFHYDRKNKVYVCCRNKNNNTSYNDMVLIYNVQRQAWTRRTSWVISRIAQIGEQLYGINSNSATIYKMLSSYQDAGIPISSRILFPEVNFGDPVSLKDADSIWIKGILSSNSVIKMSIHVWDHEYTLHEDYHTIYWIGSGVDQVGFGLGDTPLGGINTDKESIQQGNIGQTRIDIDNFAKIQLEITSSQETPHEIHYIRVSAKEGREMFPENLLNSEDPSVYIKSGVSFVKHEGNYLII